MMARKTEITRERILEVGLNKIRKDGYGSLTIHSLASEIGCSTQPIASQFGNMPGLREALREYALAYANGKMEPKKQTGTGMFEDVGRGYIGLALYEPKIFQFLFMEGYAGQVGHGLESLVSDEENKELAAMISHTYDITTEHAKAYIENTIVYTHGIASLVAAGVICEEEEKLLERINQAGNQFLIAAGVTKEQMTREDEK